MEIYANHPTALRAITDLKNPDLEIVAEKEYRQRISDLLDDLHRAVKADQIYKRYHHAGESMMYTSGFKDDGIALKYDKKDGSVFVTFTYCGKSIGMATIRDE